MSLPGSIGNVVCKVILSSSPFNVVTTQEWGYFFSPDDFVHMLGPDPTETGEVADADADPSVLLNQPQDVYPMPYPVAGYRIAEQLENYDNFIMDATDTFLEESEYGDGASKENYNSIKDRTVGDGVPVTGCKKFFGWKTANNIFGDVAPQNFGDNSAAGSGQYRCKWIYKKRPTPSGTMNGDILTPFMTSSSQNDQVPIHWGCTRTRNLQYNQPFELLYYHEGLVHNVPEKTPDRDTTEGFKSLFGIDLTKRAYFVVQVGPSNNAIWFIFAQGVPPTMITMVQDQYRIVSQFQEFESGVLFTPQSDFFQCKFEPCRTGFIITIVTSSFVRPWAIQPPGDFPYLWGGRDGKGEAEMTVYSGNIQCGFAFRPIQYAPKGIFRPPAQTIEVVDGGPDVQCTPAIKGVGEIQQNTTSTPEGDVVYAVDAESVTPETEGGNFKTVIANATGIDIETGGTRTINISMAHKDLPPEEKLTSSISTPIKRQMWQPTVEMTPADVAFADLVLPRARSPYIWQLRCSYEPPDQSGGGGGGAGTDISCDVMSVELQWNATSAWEVVHSGSIKVLNRPNDSGTDYYAKYSDRAVYLKIEAGWDCGEGIEPAQIFEGLTVSATLDKTAERDVVTFKIEDYMYALEGIKFILSPYYDGMQACAAVHDILKHAGLPEDSMDITKVDFGLPFVNAFEEPQFRFKDGSSIKAAVTKIAELAGMMIYFDELGTFFYQPIPGGYLFDQTAVPVARLYSSVANTSNGADLIWSSKSLTRNIGDTYNSVLVSTVDRATGNIIHVGINNDKAITDANATGYQGFRKMAVFRNPALGSKAAADNYLQFYSQKFIVPPRTGRFQLYGRPDIIPMDTIYVDDELFKVMNISLQIDKEQNNFFMNVEGEWFDN